MKTNKQINEIILKQLEPILIEIEEGLIKNNGIFKYKHNLNYYMRTNLVNQLTKLGYNVLCLELQSIINIYSYKF